MVFDFAVFDKPCLFFNYNVEHKKDENWSIGKVYDFVHFRNMPTGKEVFWINSKDKIKCKLSKALKSREKKVKKAKTWFEIINQHPTENASERIWEQLEQIPLTK
jgi:CDP-glycerol glycerophosphotransferase (TagB/SpsB family)